MNSVCRCVWMTVDEYLTAPRNLIVIAQSQPHDPPPIITDDKHDAPILVETYLLQRIPVLVAHVLQLFSSQRRIVRVQRHELSLLVEKLLNFLVRSCELVHLFFQSRNDINLDSAHKRLRFYSA